jgi:hypothetical protein
VLEVNWEPRWFRRVPKGYWDLKENRRKFLDSLFQTLNLKSLSDWGKVKKEDINEHGGNTLLMMYETSIFKMLKDNYPGLKY